VQFDLQHSGKHLEKQLVDVGKPFVKLLVCPLPICDHLKNQIWFTVRLKYRWAHEVDCAVKHKCII